MLRVFLASSHLGTLLITISARRSHREGVRDVLVIDNTIKKDSLRKTITDTAALHKWENVYDLSLPVPDTKNLKPGMVKKITRKIKTYPVVRNVYGLLHKEHVKRTRQQQVLLIKKEFAPGLLKETPVHLGLLMETALNDALREVFPGAEEHYFEHGMSDYMLIAETAPGNIFHCVFAESFRKYLHKRNRNSHVIHPVLADGEFGKACDAYLQEHPDKAKLSGVCTPGKPHVLILLQSIEQYNVPFKVWQELVERIFSKTGDPRDHVFLVKPHPLQSQEVMEWMHDFFLSKKLDYHVLNEPFILNTSVEVAFDLWKEHVTHVFSLFSSSVYYLSKLYPLPHIKYFHSYDFMLPYLKHAPAHNRNMYLAHKELIEEVFSERCESF